MADTPDPGSVRLPSAQPPPSGGGVDPGSVRLPGGQQLAQNAINATPLKIHGQPALQAILERSGQIIPAGIHRGLPAAFNALIHGVPAAQYEQDVRSVSGLPPTGHGAELFGNEMALDPATYFGMGKLGEKLVPAIGKRLAPTVMGIAKKFGDVEHIGKNDPWWLRAPGAIHDFFTPGGQPVAHAARKLALKHGPEGVVQTQRMESVAAGGQAVGASFSESLKSLAHGVLKGVSDEDQTKIFSAIHNGTIGKLPTALQEKAKALQTLDRSIPYVMGTPKMRAHLRDNLGFVLPEPLQVFDPAKPHGLVGLKDFREQHVATPHGLNEAEQQQAFTNLRKVGGKRALTDVRNRYFQQRIKEPGEDYFADAPMVREVMERSFDAAGKQLTGATTRAGLLDIFGGGAPSGRLGDVKLLKAQDIKNKIAEGKVPQIKGSLKPESAGSPLLYHETDPTEALSHFIWGTPESGLFASPYEDLALGQGLNKGGRISFERSALDPSQIQNVYHKPGLDFIKNQRGEWPEQFVMGRVPKQNVRSVTIPGDFFDRPGYEQTNKGWKYAIKTDPSITEERLPSGEIRLTRKEAKPPRQTTQRGGINTANFKRRVPGYVQKAYAAKSPEEPGVGAQALKFAENLGNLGKSTLFVTPFGHQRNISTELLLANPAAIPRAVANYAKMGLGFASPAKKAKVLGDAMKEGATGIPNVEQSGLTNLFDQAAKRLGKIAGFPARVASAVYKYSGKALWAWDDASKEALQHFAKKRFGGDAYRAAAYVRKHLVDYGLTSPAQDAARLAAPFATWRTRMPQAVALSLAEHPEYGIALDRLTHGAATGAPFSVPWSKKKQESSNPLAEFGDLVPGSGNQHKYLRSSLSLTAQVLADLGAKGLGMKEIPYPASSLETRIPIAGQAMSLGGKSPYGDTPMEELMYMLLGTHPSTTPKRKHMPPRPRM